MFVRLSIAPFPQQEDFRAQQDAALSGSADLCEPKHPVRPDLHDPLHQDVTSETAAEEDAIQV